MKPFSGSMLFFATVLLTASAFDIHSKNRCTIITKGFAETFLDKYSGTYSVEIGKSDWGEIYVLTNDGKAKWMFLDARTKSPQVMQTLTGRWSAKESYIRISISGSPNGVEEYEMKNGIFYNSKTNFKRYLKRQ